MTGQATVDELIDAWDTNESIWTLEMGGLGPGYEQAIQIMAVEFARAGRSFIRTGDDTKDGVAWSAICDKALKPIDDAIQGASGAQYGAARWLAWQWCFGAGGPAGLIERSRAKTKADGKDDDRVMMCSRHFPVAPPPPAQLVKP